MIALKTGPAGAPNSRPAVALPPSTPTRDTRAAFREAQRRADRRRQAEEIGCAAILERLRPGFDAYLPDHDGAEPPALAGVCPTFGPPEHLIDVTDALNAAEMMASGLVRG